MSQALNATPNEAARRTLFDATYARLLSAIAERTWADGAKLPSEIELAGLLGVSRPLLREVLRELQRQGHIVRRHGAGTFVATPPRIEARLPAVVSLEIAAAGTPARVEEVRRTVELVTVAGDGPPPPLPLAPGEALWRIERVKTVDGRPALAIVDHFPASLVPADQIERETGASVLGLVLAHADAPTVRVANRLVADQADEGSAARLAVPPGTVVMTIERTVHHPDGSLLLASRIEHVASRFTFTVDGIVTTGHDTPPELPAAS